MISNLSQNRPERENRIRELAYQLWESDGRPNGRDVEFWERARELVANEESARAGPEPAVTGAETLIEVKSPELSSRVTDQGKRPKSPPRSRKRPT